MLDISEIFQQIEESLELFVQRWKQNSKLGKNIVETI